MSLGGGKQDVYNWIERHLAGFISCGWLKKDQSLAILTTMFRLKVKITLWYANSEAIFISRKNMLH